MSQREGALVSLGAVAAGAVVLALAGVPAVGAPTPAIEVPLDVLREIPAGLSVLLPVPRDNPLTPRRIALGRRLFFDARLSHDGRVACASCHRPEHGFADVRPVSLGAGRRTGRRNAPSLLNRAYATALFWDGRAPSLEAQALGPLLNELELGNAAQDVGLRLGADPTYRLAFRDAFGDEAITPDRVAQALAGFERTLLSGGAAADRYELGDRAALPPPARRGRDLFRAKARCHVCHSGPLFTDDRFHNTGVSWGREPLDLGRFEVTGLDADRGAFRTPSLRDAARTAPYMHDGSLRTLADVVAFYDRGGTPNPLLDGRIRPLGLTSGERRDLVAFLQALTGR